MAITPLLSTSVFGAQQLRQNYSHKESDKLIHFILTTTQSRILKNPFTAESQYNNPSFTTYLNKLGFTTPVK